MNLRDVKQRTDMARKAAWLVHELDYGFTTHATKLGDDRALLLTQVYRGDVDGYIGYKMIALDLLKEILSGKGTWHAGSWE